MWNDWDASYSKPCRPDVGFKDNAKTKSPNNMFLLINLKNEIYVSV